MLTWTKEFETGSELVDEQHRVLVDKLNELERMLEGPLPPREACDGLIAFLESHVDSHFRYEEGCMERARCPAHARNKRAHDGFLVVFGHFKQRYLREGPSVDLFKTLHSVASTWTENHILNVDSHLRTCVAG
jgi:hemerythrin